MKIINMFTGRKFRPFYAVLFSVGLSISMVSCYPGDPISPSDTDVVTTFRNAAVDFSTKLTYAMPDSVLHIGKDGPVDSDFPVFDQQILSDIRTNLDQYGFNQVANPDQADVLVLPMVSRTQWVSGGCYPWYWGYYYPYPGYCYPVAYTYETGTILILMVDPDLSLDDPNRDALWIAGINGLLSSSSNTASRIDRGINQAFEQSPYLGDGK